MGQPAAKKGDQVTATDTHIVLVPAPPSPPVPTPLPHPFKGIINGQLSSSVKVMGLEAATVGSTADNTPQHIPTPPGTAFQKTPANKATIKTGSLTVKVNGQPVARNGDQAETCNDPVDMPIGTVVATGSVLIG
ncbi:MAG: PAAR domain-containing protein [Blastocatellia bacterium]